MLDIAQSGALFSPARWFCGPAQAADSAFCTKCQMTATWFLSSLWAEAAKRIVSSEIKLIYSQKAAGKSTKWHKIFRT